MSFLNSIISEHLINTLGWTLIHSLWQGAAAALGFALVLFFLRRISARTRYAAGVLALTLVLVTSAVTFVSLYQTQPPGDTVTPLSLQAAVQTGDRVINGDRVTTGAFFKTYFNRHLPLVVTLWLMGVLVLMLRFAGGFLYNQRVKTHQTRPLPASPRRKLDALARRAGFNQPIRLIESALAKVPMAIGFFKPVILFPMGMISGMPADQVEALLAHELAHVLRRDYLVNILQRFVDILFFYHPGVRWISTQVRGEREHCCDDIAVSLSGDSVNVARALSRIERYGMSAPEPAMAASGTTSRGAYGLLGRVKRLLSPRASRSPLSEGFAGAVILMAGLLILVVSADAAAALNRDLASGDPLNTVLTTAAQEEEEPEPTEAVKQKIRSIEKEMAEKRRTLEKKMAGMRKQQETLHSKNKKLNKSQKEELARLKTELKKHEKNLKELEKHRAKMYAHQKELEKHEAEMEAHEKELEQHEHEMEDHEKELEKREFELQAHQEELEKREFELQAHQKELEKHEHEMHAHEKEMEEHELEMQAHEEEMKRHEAEMKEHERVMRLIEAELIKDKLIADADQYEFSFKKDGLYINGKKQPKAVYQKYKKLYEKELGKKINEKGSFSTIRKHR